jgi:hypothetical protein
VGAEAAGGAAVDPPGSAAAPDLPDDHFLLGDLGSDGIEALVAAAGPASGSNLFVVELRQLGGAFATGNADGGVVDHLDVVSTGRAADVAQAMHEPGPHSDRACACCEEFPFSGQVRPSAAALARRAGPVLAPLRAAGPPAPAHDKGPVTEEETPQATGPRVT